MRYPLLLGGLAVLLVSSGWGRALAAPQVQAGQGRGGSWEQPHSPFHPPHPHAPQDPETVAPLTGTIYIDLNNNGQRDSVEPAFCRPVVVTESQRALTATADPGTGHFEMLADTGRYFLAMEQAPPYYTLHEGAAGYYGSINSLGQPIGGNNFGLVPTLGQQDLLVTLTPYSPARPGRLTRYRMRLENVGTDPVFYGQVDVRLDPAAAIIGTVPVASQSQGQVRSWQFQNLLPFGVREYDITFSLPVTALAGTPLLATATATAAGGTELTPRNNLDSLRQQVVTSYDPNDLAVSHAELVPAQLADGTVLDYLIRFENIGSDTAFAVTIVDTLPAAQLQMSTLLVVGASHNCRATVTGRSVLTLSFPGILLPYQAIDALRSQGFVRFQVKPRSTLVAGVLIPGAAHIVFDHNAPIATNRVTTVIKGPTATPGLLAAADAAWSLYPNPADAATRVLLAADAPVAGMAGVRLHDALGRVVREATTPVAAGALRLPLDVGALPAGVYSVELRLPTRPVTVRRLVVR